MLLENNLDYGEGGSYCWSMKTFPLASPPDHAGIYALTNRVTGRIYVGQTLSLRRRFWEWKSVFATGLGAKNKAVLAVVQADGPDDWEFAVLFDMPGATALELSAVETRAITHVSNARPRDILNKMVAAAEVEAPERRLGSVPKSKVVSADGTALSYRQVAEMTGVTPEAVKHRLRKYREKGITEVSIDLLKDRSASPWRPKASLTSE